MKDDSTLENQLIISFHGDSWNDELWDQKIDTCPSRQRTKFQCNGRTQMAIQM